MAGRAAVVLLAIVLAIVQTASSLALRDRAQPGAWAALVPSPEALLDALEAHVPLPEPFHLVRGRHALASGDLAAAERELTHLLPSRDRDALAGGIADARGDTATALGAYLRADDLADVERSVATRVRRGDIVGALAVQHALVDRLTLDRTQIDALAQACFDLGVLDEARAVRDPVGAASRKRYEHASADAYARAVALAPLDERYLIAYANQQINLADIAAAQAAFVRAREADPTSVEPLTGLGAVAAARGDFATARAYLARARAIDPRSDAVVRLARALHA